MTCALFIARTDTAVVSKWLVPWANCVVGRDIINYSDSVMSARRGLVYRRFPAHSKGDLFIDPCAGGYISVSEFDFNTKENHLSLLVRVRRYQRAIHLMSSL